MSCTAIPAMQLRNGHIYTVVYRYQVYTRDKWYPRNKRKAKSFKCSSTYRWLLLLIIHFTISTTKVTNTTIISKTTIIIFPLRWSRCDPMMGRRALVGAHTCRGGLASPLSPSVSARPPPLHAQQSPSRTHRIRGSLNYSLLLNWCKKFGIGNQLFLVFTKRCLTDFTNLAI